MIVNIGVMDRHRVDADPDPAFHFDTDPDPDPDSNPDSNPSFVHTGKFGNKI